MSHMAGKGEGQMSIKAYPMGKTGHQAQAAKDDDLPLPDGRMATTNEVSRCKAGNKPQLVCFGSSSKPKGQHLTLWTVLIYLMVEMSLNWNFSSTDTWWTRRGQKGRWGGGITGRSTSWEKYSHHRNTPGDVGIKAPRLEPQLDIRGLKVAAVV